MEPEVPGSRPAPLGPRVGLLSRVLAVACWALAICLPLAVIYALIATPLDSLLSGAGIVSGVVAARVGPLQRAAVFVLGVMPVAFMAYGLVRAARCFGRFARREYFATQTVHDLRGLATGMLAAAIAGPVVPVLVSLVLSLGAAGGDPSVKLDITSHQLLLLLFGGLVWQIASVMARAAALAEEHSQFV